MEEGAENIFLKKSIAGGLLISLTTGILWLLSCQKKEQTLSPESFSEAAREKKVVLRVENEDYSEADFYQYVEKQVGKSFEGLTAAALSRLFDQFVETKLWLEAARREGLSVSEAEKEAYKRRLSAELGDSAAFPFGEEEVTEKLMVEKYFQLLSDKITVSDQEILDYYNLHRREFLLPERVKVSQIIVENEAKAVRLHKELKDNDEALFRKLARENSVGPEASRGGELGIFGLNDLPQEIEKVVFSLPEGGISSVVESPYGYHIFRLDRRYGPRLMTLEEVAAKIKSRLLEEKTADLMMRQLQELKASVDWEFFPERLSFRYEKEDQ